jgi:hypothetical protein
MSLGNVLRVDIYGDDTAANAAAPYFTVPFRTVQAAVAKATSGTTVWVLPGTHDLTAGVVLPNGICLRGMNVQTTVIRLTGVTADTTLLTMGESCRVEDVTLSLTSTGHHTLKGIVFPGSSNVTSKLRTSVLTVDNSTASTGGSSNVYGIYTTGNGTLGAASFSFNSLKGSTINVLSNGGGTKRGVLVASDCIVTTRDLNVYVAAPTDAASTGSYVGIEVNAGATGAIQLRSTTIGTRLPVYVASPTAIQQYTASDILQTTPDVIENPGYLASAGIQVGPGTDLVTKSAGKNPFSTYVYPLTLYYGLKGTPQNNGFLWPGTQQATLNNFPDPSGYLGSVQINVTSTSNGNRVNVVSVANLMLGIPVIFDTGIGGLTAGTVYYIESIHNTTYIHVSTTPRGTAINTLSAVTLSVTANAYLTIFPDVTSVNASNQVAVTSTSGLVVGMPVTFTDYIGYLNVATQYYINGIGAGYITVSSTIGGSTVTTGTMTKTTLANVFTPNILVTGTGSGNGHVDFTNTGNQSGLQVGMPMVFATSVGGLVAGTIYYIINASKNTQITVSTTLGGTAYTGTTSTSGQTVAGYVWSLTSAPAYYRMQQPALLSGMTASVSTNVGAGKTCVLQVYRTPGGADLQRGITLVKNYTLTIDNTANSQSYYNSSRMFSASDRLSLFLTYSGLTPSVHDMSVQLDLF